MPDNKKYELTDDVRALYTGETVHRIRALRDFGNVKKGELGGYVESEFNLSHEGNAWVYGTAKVFNRARVIENGKVLQNAIVYGQATVSKNAVVDNNAQVSDRAILTDFASVSGHAVVCERAIIKEYANLFGRACVSGEAVVGKLSHVGGGTYVSGKAEIAVDTQTPLMIHASICGNALILSQNDIITVGPIGSRADTLIAYRSKNHEDIELIAGLFHGTLDEFIHLRWKNNLYLEQYQATISFIKQFFKINNKESADEKR